MRRIVFHAKAFEQFTAWSQVDAGSFERITRLIAETVGDPFRDIGRPEPLRHQLNGFWSRLINDEHRRVYEVKDDALIIASCRFHY